MFVLGLVLILLSAGALVAVLASGTDDRSALYGGTVELPTLVIFLAGAAALLLFIMGLELVRSGIKRANTNRKNSKRLRKLEKEGVVAPGGAGTTTGTGGPGPGTSGTATAGGTTAPGGTSASGGTTTSGGTTGPGSTGTEDGPYQTPPPAR